MIIRQTRSRLEAMRERQGEERWRTIFSKEAAALDEMMGVVQPKVGPPVNTLPLKSIPQAPEIATQTFLQPSEIAPDLTTSAISVGEKRAVAGAATRITNDLSVLTPESRQEVQERVDAQRTGGLSPTSLMNGKVNLTDHVFNILGASSFAGNRFIAEAVADGTPIAEAAGMAWRDFLSGVAGDAIVEGGDVKRLSGVDVLDAFSKRLTGKTATEFSNELENPIAQFFVGSQMFFNGLALDILLDPITYIPGGVFTKLSKVERLKPVVEGIAATRSAMGDVVGASRVGEAADWTRRALNQHIGVRFRARSLVKGLAQGDNATRLAEALNKHAEELLAAGVVKTDNLAFKDGSFGSKDLQAGAAQLLMNHALKSRMTRGHERQLRTSLRSFVSGLSEEEYIPLLMYLDQPNIFPKVAHRLAGEGNKEHAKDLIYRANELRSVLKEMGEREASAGVFSHMALREDYLPGITPQTEHAQSISNIITELRAGGNAALVKEQQERIGITTSLRRVQGADGVPYWVFPKEYPTREARVVSATPTDLTAGGIARRGYDGIRRVATNNFRNSVLSDSRVVLPIDPSASIIDTKKLQAEGLDLYKLPGAATSGNVHEVAYIMPSSMKRELDLADGVFRDPNAASKFGRAYRMSMTLWKSYALLSPGYHMRNHFSNLWNNYIAGVNVFNDKGYIEAMVLQAGGTESLPWGLRQQARASIGRKIDSRRQLSFVNPETGQRVDGETLWNEMNDRGVVNTGQASVETRAGLEGDIADVLRDEIKAKLQSKGLIPEDAVVGDMIEGWGPKAERVQRVSGMITKGLTRQGGGAGRANISKKEADQLAELFDSMARTWGWNNGVTPDKWYEKFLFGFGEMLPDSPQGAINKLADASEGLLTKKYRIPSRRSFNQAKDKAAGEQRTLEGIDAQLEDIRNAYNTMQDRADVVEEGLMQVKQARKPKDKRPQHVAAFMEQEKGLRRWRRRARNRHRILQAHFDELDTIEDAIAQGNRDATVLLAQRKGIRNQQKTLKTEAQFRAERERVRRRILKDNKELASLEEQMVALEEMRPASIQRLSESSARMLLLNDGRMLLKASRGGKSHEVIQLMGRMALRTADHGTLSAIERWLLPAKTAASRKQVRELGGEAQFKSKIPDGKEMQLHLLDLPEGEKYANQFGKGFLAMVAGEGLRPGASVSIEGMPAGMNQAVFDAVQDLGLQVRQQTQTAGWLKVRVPDPTIAQKAKAGRILSKAARKAETSRPEVDVEDVAKLEQLAKEAETVQILDKGTQREIGRLFGTGIDPDVEDLRLLKDVQAGVRKSNQPITGFGRRAVAMGKTMVDPNNWLLTWNRRIGTAVEDNARALHFIDRFKAGHSMDAAEESVKKYLFDYTDLSEFEQEKLKLFIPFYTWMRKNIPLQFQAAWSGPQLFNIRGPVGVGKYKTDALKGITFGGNRYKTAQRIQENFEDLSSEWEDLPEYDYFAEINALRTPWEAYGKPIYVSPDLPFNDLNRALSLNDYITSISPIVRFGGQFLMGLPMGSVDPLTGAVIDKDAPSQGIGTVLEDLLGTEISRPTEAVIENMMPPVGRLSRLKKNIEDNEGAEWLARFMGFGMRTLDPDKAVRNRVHALSKITSTVRKKQEDRMKVILKAAQVKQAKRQAK